MINNFDVNAIDVIILCGGMGTRLQSVMSDKPKPMADFNDRPFLDLLIDYVGNFGFKRFILCTGHKGDLIKTHFEKKDDGRSYVISQETSALGTAGALKNAESAILSDIFLVMNGDSFCPVDLISFLSFHSSKNALVSVALAPMEDTSDYGGVALRDNDEIICFDEKTNTPTSGWVNAGIYAFTRKALDHIPAREKVSLEMDIFPSLAGKGLFGFGSQSQLLDIGTPDRLEQARKFLIDLK
jgi:D-glycero-alpha-D-manno-heptose 1-phosphate guanylyltransferase